MIHKIETGNESHHCCGRASTVHQGYRGEIMIHAAKCFDANMSDVFFHGLIIPRPAGALRQKRGQMIEAIGLELLGMGWNRLAAPMNDHSLEVFNVAYGKGAEDLQPYGAGRAYQAVAEAKLPLRRGH